MISHDHTFHSDPHIADPIRWIESLEDPMLLKEANVFKVRKRRRERIQLLFGSFLLLLIVTMATPVMREPARVLRRAAIVEAGERKIREVPAPRIAPPEILAHAYVVRFVGTSVPQMYQREWKEVAPASITKIMTAMTALENLPTDRMITISNNAKTVGGKMSTSPAGEIFSRDAMIQLALIESANDAAYALGEAVEKEKTGNNPTEGFPEFLKVTRDIAAKVGMTHTNFLNPTGLDQDGHLTTAEDLAMLAEYIWLNHPELWEITKTSATKVLSEKGVVYTIENTNELLKEFPAIQGGKTGLTDEALGTLILLYPVMPSYTAVIVILGSEDRFEDGRKIIKWLEEAF